MKIIIAGGSGHVGTFLARAFHAEGHQVAVLSRRYNAVMSKVKHISETPATQKQETAQRKTMPKPE